MVVCAVIWTVTSCSGNTFLSSPDGNISVGQSLTEEGVPVFHVSTHGEEVMIVSAGGLVSEEACLCSGFEVVDIERKRVNMKWTQPWGENKTVIDRHREMYSVPH
jgi:alpha-glucosidase